MDDVASATHRAAKCEDEKTVCAEHLAGFQLCRTPTIQTYQNKRKLPAILSHSRKTPKALLQSATCQAKEEHTLPVDHLSALPYELKETICGLLDAASLKSLSRVNSNWNQTVSSMASVWRRKCIQIGGEPSHLRVVDRDWKQETEKCMAVRKRMFRGLATCDYQLSPLEQRRVMVRHVSYCNGLVVTGTLNKVFIWRLSDSMLVNNFCCKMPISSLHVSSDGVVMLHCNGMIRVEDIAPDGTLRLTGWDLWPGQVGQRASRVHMNGQMRRLAIGYPSGEVQLWCTQMRHIVDLVSQPRGVACLAVLLVPAGDVVTEHRLAVRWADCIHVYRLCEGELAGGPTHRQDTLDRQDTSLFLQGQYLCYTDTFPGLQNTHLMHWDLGRNCVCSMAMLNGVQLLAGGEHFMLVCLPWRNDMTVAVVDVKTGIINGLCSASRCRLPVVGESAWLSGLCSVKMGEAVLAFLTTKNRVQVLKWTFVDTREE